MTNNLRFFNKKHDFINLEKITQILDVTNSKSLNLADKIFNIKTLEKAANDDVSFFSSGTYLEKFLQSQAGYCFVDEKNAAKCPQHMKPLIVKDPYFAFALMINQFYETKNCEFLPNTLIHPAAKIGKNCQIAANVYIGKNVEIGDNCIIHPQATILDNVIIGNDCIIGANCVISFAVIGDNCSFFNGVKIGQDGFGFVHHQGKNFKINQVGIVEIGNFVEIGANSCVDRGALDNTIIHDQVKIDNLCQIAHNVEIGYGSVIAGSSALAGSCKIGKFVQIGGKSSILGHITIDDGAKIAGMSGVIRDVDKNQIMAGIPAVAIKKWHRMNIILDKLASQK